MTYLEAHTILIALGLTHEQITHKTGMGHRRSPHHNEVDQVGVKFQHGSLSEYGVMAAMFGYETWQHLKGHNLPTYRDSFVTDVPELSREAILAR